MLLESPLSFIGKNSWNTISSVNPSLFQKDVIRPHPRWSQHACRMWLSHQKKKPIKCTYNFPTSIVQFSSHLFNYISVGCIVWILVDYKQQEYWPQTLLTQHICFLTIICSKCFVVFHMMTWVKGNTNM